MDDTVPMQDTNGLTASSHDPAGSKAADAEAGDSVSSLKQQQLAADAGLTADCPSSAQAPQSPALLTTQQVHCDASSVASDGSQEQAGSTGSASRQHGPPRRNYSSADVDMAKQAAMSALAGLDMTTTKANLDASKAAAATARANGEVPAHVRKSTLRSVSCRQLGTGSSGAGGVGKSVAFDEPISSSSSKPRPEGAPTRTVQWKAGTSSGDGSQVGRPARAPAGRAISLPHVLQGRAGMANRLAASYAQEAALQQQLQLLNGSNQGAHAFAAAGAVQQLQAGAPNMDVLSLYQLQQQQQQAGGQLLMQRSFGANAVATMDDSLLQMRSSNALLAAQQQQQQAQAVQLAGNWAGGAAAVAAPLAGQQRVTWAPGTAQGQQQAPLTNQQLLLQLQPQAGGVGAAGTDTLWLQNPAVASNALLNTSNSRPQSLMLGGQQAAGAGVLSPHMQQQQQPGGLPANSATSALLSTFTLLLEQSQAVSWSLVAAAQADSRVREQLLTEVVLQLTLLHTLGGVLKSTLGPADALNDLSYLGSAARRHIATFSRLSQSGDMAVQLLAMIAPLACRHLTGTEVLEAAFLVLDTLALANRDVAAVVTQQRLAALSNLLVPLPVEQLLQQQTLGLAWINSMTASVSRMKQMLEGINSVEVAAAAGQQPPASAGLSLHQGAAGAGAGLSLGGVPLSQPLLVRPPGTTLSPTGKTPLATYFEENQPPGLSPSGAAAAGAGAGGLGMPGLTTAVGPDGLLRDGLGGFSLVSPTAAGAGGSGAANADAAAVSLAGLQLGVATGAGAQAGAPNAAAGAPRAYSPLSSGLPLFGDTSLLGSSNSAPAGGTSGSGVPAGIVGV